MAHTIELVESLEITGDLVRPVHKYSIDNDIDKLFETIDIKNAYKSLLHSEKNSKDAFSKSAMKRSMRVSSSRSSGIGFSESASLKQAFRGLCISHASEMAALKKQLSKATPSGISKALGKGKGRLLEVSLVPESSIAMSSSLGYESNRSNVVGTDCIYARIELKKRLKLRNASIGSSLNTKLPVLDENVCDYTSRSRRKVKTSFSSRSSTGDNRSSISSSEESFISGSSCKRYRPHMSKDSRWKAIRYVEQKQGSLGLKHFKLLKKLGGGDIGDIYLSVLIGTNCLFALKVMDIDLLASRRKLTRAQTEKEILQILDHPFLPSLYAHFTTEKFSCLLMEYCSGGDLHVLRQMQLKRSFSEQATRFYIAEVVLALEYLHMIGVVYRDLKPENVLVQEDGHIMLTDFDLSLKCAVNLTMLKTDEHPKTTPSRPSLHISCIYPSCFQTSLQIPCFNATIVSQETTQSRALPLLVVEPIDARSNSFVGTHEYLAPEMIKGEGHGSAVDWWTLGILLYELLYGITPFKGENDDILTNIVSESLAFPETPIVSSNARDLIRCLLKKEPQERLGFEKGAAEIKQHPFFQGLNWALIRCKTPPHLPIIASYDMGSRISRTSSYNIEKERGLGDYAIAEDTVLEMI